MSAAIKVGLFCACGNGLEMEVAGRDETKAVKDVQDVWYRLHSGVNCRPCDKETAERVATGRDLNA